MSTTVPGEEPIAPKAEHGASSEVTWDGGAGHQPYGNQGSAQEAAEAPGAEEFSEGDRGAASGRNVEQLEAVKTKP